MQPAGSSPSPTWPRRLLPVLLVLLAALAVLGVLWARSLDSAPVFRGTTYDPPAPAPGFALTDHTGTPRTLNDFAGRPLFLFFGYTHCPDVCPLTLARLSEALREAGVAQGDAHILLVTVDPQRDSPEVLARYIEPFGPYVTALTGSAAQLAPIYPAYGVHAGDSEHASEVMHTTAVFGIDSGGMLRAIIRADDSREALVADVETLLTL